MKFQNGTTGKETFIELTNIEFRNLGYYEFILHFFSKGTLKLKFWNKPQLKLSAF